METEMKELDEVGRTYFRDAFRTARADALKDAEAFDEILFVIERFGAFLTEEQSDLGEYEEALADVAGKSPLAKLSRYKCGPDFDRLYTLVRRARNDAMHQGAYARHLATNATILSVVLEDALMAGAGTLQDFMVRDPVCAEIWQPLALVRQKMLLNAFSFLPVREETGKGGWHFVSDMDVARYVRGGRANKRNKRLAEGLGDVVAAGGIKLREAKCFVGTTTLEEVMNQLDGYPVLVIDKDHSDQLLGIVSAFDIL